MNSLPNKANPENSGLKIGTFLRKHGFSLVLGVAMVTMLVNPDAKSWVLQKLMLTGLFNPAIDEQPSNVAASTTADFEFIDDQGVLHNTASLRGKVVFINFWASWCGPCRAEFPSIEQLYSKFKTHPEVYFLTINADDDRAKADRYLAKKGFTVPFHQSNGFIPDAVYTGSLPTTVVLDKKGVIRYRHEGFANYASDAFIGQMEELIGE